MKRILFLIPLAVVLTACKPATTGSVPTAPPLTGACNAADSTMYQTLIFAQGSILNLNATITADEKGDPNTASIMKPYVAKAAQDYNIAEASWQGYHAACMANPSLSPAAAQTQVNQVSSDIQAVPGGAK